MPEADHPLSDPDFVSPPESLAAPPSMAWSYPLGSKIEMGERVTHDGPTTYIALTAAGMDMPSLILWVDPVSFQPMLTVYNRSTGHVSYPLDKVIRSPYQAAPGNPFKE